MQIHLDDLATQQVSQCLELLQAVFGSDLLGLYLYGSAVMGGLQLFSDIDLFAVTSRRASLPEKAKIAAQMLEISGVYRMSSKRSLELTIVVQSEVNPWHYPPDFDFQYGDWLRAQFSAGVVEPWESRKMPDLALLITQVLLASQTLYGPQPDRLLVPVPYLDIIAASTDEIDRLLADLEPDTRNVLLTLARIWSTLETDAIWSKHAAAAWAVQRLPVELRPVMQRARDVYLGAEDPGWDDLSARVEPCAGYITAKIKAQAAWLRSTGNTRRAIHLGD